MMFTTFLKIEYYIFLSFKNIYIFKFKNLHLENTFTNWKAKCLDRGMQFRKTLNPPSMSGAHPELYPSRLEQNRSSMYFNQRRLYPTDIQKFVNPK